jgi:hypothetical protein
MSPELSRPSCPTWYCEAPPAPPSSVCICYTCLTEYRNIITTSLPPSIPSLLYLPFYTRFPLPLFQYYLTEYFPHWCRFPRLSSIILLDRKEFIMYHSGTVAYRSPATWLIVNILQLVPELSRDIYDFLVDPVSVCAVTVFYFIILVVPFTIWLPVSYIKT